MLATANTHTHTHTTSGKALGEMQVKGQEGWKLARKKSLAVSVLCVDKY